MDREAWQATVHGVAKESDTVHFSRSVVSNSFRPHEPQHASPPCPSPTYLPKLATHIWIPI